MENLTFLIQVSLTAFFPMALTVRVIAPDKTVWDSEAEEVILPSTTGQLGILGGHAPLLTALDVGVMRVRAEKEWVPIALMGGFAEVESDEGTILNAATLSTQPLPSPLSRKLRPSSTRLSPTIARQ